MKIRIAELNIEIAERSPCLAAHCRDYLAAFDAPDFAAAATDEEIAEEQKRAGVSPEAAELACVYRAIARVLPDYDAFVFHAAAVMLDGVAYAFAAPSGTGKSTHAALWLRAFGDRATVLNGDKPIFRFVGGQLRAYGTPWCGKEGLSANAGAPLAGLCFLERGEKNRIERIGDDEAVRRLFAQILMPDTAARTEKFIDLLSRMIGSVPCYLLSCNTEPEAARVALAGMKKE